MILLLSLMYPQKKLHVTGVEVNSYQKIGWVKIQRLCNRYNKQAIMMNDDKQKLTQDRPATCQIKVPGHLWYALSIQAFPVAIAIVLALGLLLGASTIINFTMPTFATAMIPLAVIFFVFAFFALLGGVLSQQRRGQSETQSAMKQHDETA